MAGDWIKVEKNTPNKPEVYHIAEVLGIDRANALLGCLRVWIWFDERTVNGNARSVTLSTIDDAAGIPGFANTMREAGWLAVA